MRTHNNSTCSSLLIYNTSHDKLLLNNYCCNLWQGLAATSVKNAISFYGFKTKLKSHHLTVAIPNVHHFHSFENSRSSFLFSSFPSVNTFIHFLNLFSSFFIILFYLYSSKKNPSAALLNRAYVFLVFFLCTPAYSTV